jgi:Protein of unknown function (DUF3995)
MNRAAYGAAAWSILFAAMSAFWALGGTLGLDTLGNEIERDARAREPDVIALVWVTALLKVVGAALVIATWIVGLGVLAYALASFAQHGLMKADVVDTPVALGSSAVGWHLALWDPFWLLGGLLFIAAARQAGRVSSGASARSARPR